MRACTDNHSIFNNATSTLPEVLCVLGNVISMVLEQPFSALVAQATRHRRRQLDALHVLHLSCMMRSLRCCGLKSSAWCGVCSIGTQLTSLRLLQR